MAHFETGTWAYINYPTSGMKYFRTHWLSTYSNTPSPSSTTSLALPPTKRCHNHTYSSVGKYVPWDAPISPIPNFHFATNGKYAYFRGVPLVPPHPTFAFWCHISCQKFGTKIGKYSIFPET